MTKSKKTSKKNAKKYSLSRSDVASRLEELIEQLEKIDPMNEAPVIVADEINSVVSELVDIAYEVTDEAV